MRRIALILTIFFAFFADGVLHAQQRVVDNINEYGKFDRWCVRQVAESDVIGGKTKYLYEFFGNGDTLVTREPLAKPSDYLWRTNNVLANVCGVYKTNTTVFPEKRGNGYCARIETHIEEVNIPIGSLQVVCQGGVLIGDLIEPIRNTKDPLSKVLYGTCFNGRPKALVYDYKADVGHTVVRGTGFSRLKTLDYPDYPEVCIILQKRWEDEDGGIHALRVGTGYERITKDSPDWVNGYSLEVRYGDITSSPLYKEYMGLQSDPDTAFRTLNSKGRNVSVVEEGWAGPDVEPNFMIIKFLSSCHEAFYGGVGNVLWVDNVHLEM